MLVRLFISLTCLLASASSAMACVPMPTYDSFTGRNYNFYNGVSTPQDKNILGENKFIAIIKTRGNRKRATEYDEYDGIVLKHKLIETLHGNIINFPKRTYPDDSQNPSETRTYENNLNFGFWEALNIRSPNVLTWNHDDSCGGYEPRLILQSKSLYLTFGSVDSNGSAYIASAVKLKSKQDPIVNAFRSIANDEPNAPNKMNAETYFKNMSGFAQVDVIQCPKKVDLRYEDSRFTKPEDQIGELFSVKDSYAIKDSELNIQDFNAYYLQLEWKNGRKNASPTNCGYGDKLLILKSHYNKYLTITDGHINTKQIATNITITGDNLVAVSDIKNWIREANTKTTP